MSFKYWLPHLQNSISKDCSKQEQTTGIICVGAQLDYKGNSSQVWDFLFFLVRLFDLCILLKQSQSSILAAFTNLRSGIIINPEFTYYTAFVALFLLQCDTLISCDSILFKFCFCGDWEI